MEVCRCIIHKWYTSGRRHQQLWHPAGGFGLGMEAETNAAAELG